MKRRRLKLRHAFHGMVSVDLLAVATVAVSVAAILENPANRTKGCDDGANKG